MRRALHETRIGHTGTLDPMATGVLLLVVGKATRLAKFLNASDKSYEAVVRFGFATDTADAQGRPLGPVSERAMPSREAIDAALDAFRGTFLQQPPAFSAKKINGQRSYKLARDARLQPSRSDDPARSLRTSPILPLLPILPFPPLPASRPPASRSSSVEADTRDAQRGLLRRLLHPIARARPRRAARRRRASGRAAADADRRFRTRPGAGARRRSSAIRSARPGRWCRSPSMLPALPAVILTTDGVARVGHGQDVRPRPSTLRSRLSGLALSPEPFVRLLDRARRTVGDRRARRAAGLLHPSVVLV